METTVKGKYLIYKGQPLVRENNTICYGSTDNKCVLFLMILSNKTVNINAKDNASKDSANKTISKKVEIPDSILGQVVSTDTTKKPHERILKQFNKNGLYEALDFGIDVMNRFNK